MSLIPKGRFTPEARRAGWISAAACLILASVGLTAASSAGPLRIFVVYALLPVGLGCVAVGVLNFRRWHNFSESMAACFLAVVSGYKVLGTLAGISLLFSMVYGLAFLYLLALLIYASLYIAFYVSVSFLLAIVLAWAGGAALYGLLLVMRYAGRIGESADGGKDHAPRVLRVVM